MEIKNRFIKKLWSVLKTIPFSKDCINFYFQRKHRHNSVSYWVDKFVENKRGNVVQIGSNDGITGDPVHPVIMNKTNWKVLFVEPVPYLFEKLKQNYPQQKRFSFEDIAINEGLVQTFYYVKKEAKVELPNLPSWYDQLGSFNKSNITNHLEGRLQTYIGELQVEGKTLTQLFIKHQIDSLLLLHLDTEGYDWKILSQLDLNKYKPVIILFEYKHLTEKEKRSALAFLWHQYNVFKFNDDFLCIRKEKFKRKHIKLLQTKKIL